MNVIKIMAIQLYSNLFLYAFAIIGLGYTLDLLLLTHSGALHKCYGKIGTLAKYLRQYSH